MTQYRDELRRRLRAMATAPPPPPWQLTADAAVGGLVCVGIAEQSVTTELVMAVSWSGRGVFDASSGELIARDRDELTGDWFDELALEAPGIGPLDGRRVPVAGLWGGGLLRSTRDGWSVAVHAPDWPLEMVVLQPPGSDIMNERRASGCVVIDRPSADLRAVGFSASGRMLVQATSADLRLWVRSGV